MLTDTQLGRFVRWGPPSNHHHLRFPGEGLRPSKTPFAFPAAARSMQFAPVKVQSRGEVESVPLDALLDRSGTTALVVVADGRLAYERYGNGGGRETVNRCFSVTKSVASALVGIAIGQGKLGGADDTVGQWLPEFGDSPIGGLTLRHLLEMRSGIRFEERALPWTDDATCYYSPDCRGATRRARITDPIGGYFHYNDFHPFLVGMMLERATGRRLPEFLQESLWQRIGTAFAASLTVDSRQHGFAHLESGLNATALDLAKFGQLFLDGGRWAGEEVVPAAWIEESTSPLGARQDEAWFSFYAGRPWGRVFATGKYFYKYFWWAHRVSPDEHDFFAMGALGQHVYVSPRHRTVIVRLSERFPKGTWWPPIFRQLIEQASQAA